MSENGVLTEQGGREAELRDFQRATLNILEDSESEKRRLESLHTAVLNILEDFGEERERFALAQTALLNILEDFDAVRGRAAQVQTAILNILEDFGEEKRMLEESQRALLNILEDVDLERTKSAAAVKRVEAVNTELEEFAYAASHDLKAPLRVIDNTSRWLEEDLAEHLTDETRENMTLLRGRVARMERLLDDLLEYSRIGRITDERFAEVIAVDEMIADVLALLAPPERFGISVDPAFAALRLPRMPLQHVFMNLIGNAIKYTRRPDARIEIRAWAEEGGDFYRFGVADNGPGIAPQYQEKIWQIFQTLAPRDKVEGTGIGLSVVRKIVEARGGRAWVESEPGQGSTFYFTWPAQQEHDT